jgi:hypothetical protein
VLAGNEFAPVLTVPIAKVRFFTLLREPAFSGKQ